MNGARTLSVVAVVALIVVAAAPVSAADPEPSSCVTCHTELESDALVNWKLDVHREVGLGCNGCHGGDPSPGLAEDMDAAMSASHGYRGRPSRFEIPSFCGECHANATFIKQFDPQARVDQLDEYRTSVHGIRNAQGDPVPATCIDCHGVHGILRIDVPDSPVYPTNVPGTCARCHADEETMKPYGLPTDQYAGYMRSVHAEALLEREDTAAPACNDCHGNHGATPPGVQSVANVCGQCHAREANLFRASTKKEIFDSMEFAECAVCHGNHDVKHPTPEMFRGEKSVCLTCHSPGDECDQATGRMYEDLAAAAKDLLNAEELLRSAEVAGMDVSAAAFELKSKGTTSAVEARALIHSFDEERLRKRAQDAREIAAKASEAGHAALAELQFRRRGLAVSLVLIVLVLVGLYLKIRSLD